MAVVAKFLGFTLLGLIIAVFALWVVGPYEEVDRRVDFDPSLVPDDIDGWLADSESMVPDLTPEAAKQVVWATAPGRRTPISIVYIHGFSATGWEIRPVPDRVGEALGANVFFTRLTGHGRSGAAMAEARAGDWIEDLAEAMEVGRRLGDRVIVMGTSTGGTLAGVLAADPDLAPLREGLAGMILISPNFGISSPAAQLLSWPAARAWLPLVAGDVRAFEPQNERHGRLWTPEYPTVSLLPMKALVDHAATLDWGQAEMPALFYFSPDDSVVDPAVTEAVAASWGGPADVRRITLPEGDDPTSHVIMGDVLSPNHTPDAIAYITDWISGL